MQTIMTQRSVRSFVPVRVIAVDMGATKTASALITYRRDDCTPDVSLYQTLPTRCNEGGYAVMDTIVHAVRSVHDAISDMSIPVAGISVSAATSINADDGSVFDSNGVIDNWTGMPIRANLEDEFHMPANVLGDVQAHALGEARWGVSRSARMSLCVAPGTGVGGGIVIDGKLLKGVHGIAGHIGHTLSPYAAHTQCACGCTGHIEPIASGPGIGALYQNVGVTDADFDPSIDGAEVSRRAHAGDTRAQWAIRRAGYALGQVSASCANMIDPDMIVLSGSVIRAGEEWFDSFCKGYKSQALAPVAHNRIEYAQLGDRAPLIGAAEDLLDEIASGHMQGKGSVYHR